MIAEIPSLSLRDLERAVNPRSHVPASRTISRGFGALTEVASGDIRDWIKRWQPDTSALLEKILASEPGWMVQRSDLAMQYRERRDAVNVALDIAGFDRQQALIGLEVPAEPEHFQLGDPVPVLEDSTIGDDLAVFPAGSR